MPIRSGYITGAGNVVTILLPNTGAEAARKYTPVGDSSQLDVYQHPSATPHTDGLTYYSTTTSLTAGNYVASAEGYLAPGVETLIGAANATFVSLYNPTGDTPVTIGEVS